MIHNDRLYRFKVIQFVIKDHKIFNFQKVSNVAEKKLNIDKTSAP